MATLADLVVNLSTNASPFDRGMRGARSTLGGFVGGITKGIAKLGAFGAALGGAAIGGTLAVMTKRSLESVDATAKLADAIGASTEDLTGLGFAAEQTGASQDVLNSSLTRMVRRIGLFAEGGGAAAKALEQLGFAGDDLTKLGAGEQFREIAARIAELPTAAQRGAAAFQVFGNQGQQLLGLIEQGPDGIKALTDEADRLGKTFSRVDAAQVEAANDAINRAQTAIGGVGTQLAVQLAPFIEVAANKLVAFATSGTSATGLVANGLELVSKAIGFGADTVQVLEIAFKGMQAAVTAGLSVLAEWWGILGKGIESVLNLIPGVEVKFSNVLDQIGDDLRDLASEQFEDFKSRLAEPPASEGVTAFFDDIKSEAAKTAQEIAEAAANNKPFAGLGEDAVEAANRMKQLQSQAQQLFESTRTPAEKFEQQLMKLNELRDLGLIDSDTFGRGQQQAQDKFLQSGQPESSQASRGDDRAALNEGTLAGSKQALDRILQAGQSAPTGPMEKTAKAAEKTADLQKQMLAIMKKIESKTKEPKTGEIIIGALD